MRPMVPLAQVAAPTSMVAPLLQNGLSTTKLPFDNAVTPTMPTVSPEPTLSAAIVPTRLLAADTTACATAEPFAQVTAPTSAVAPASQNGLLTT